MPKYASTILLIVLVVSGLASISTIHSGSAQTSTPVNGIIAQDTTWTKANSPYSLTGPVAVNQGVTLTIEAGTTVNLNYYYIQVNGTLTAKGTSEDQIQFNGGGSQGITFTSISNKWNEAAGSGCIIQYATIKPSLIAYDGSIKIDHCTVLGDITVAGSSVVTNSNLKRGASILGSTILSDNVISGAASAYPSAPTPIVIATSDSTIDEFPTISNNIINGRGSQEGGEIGILCYRYVKITNNTIMGCEEGIKVFSSQASGYPFIEKNAIYGNQVGIVILASLSAPVSNQPLIESNSITGNDVGIWVQPDVGISTPKIQYNNIYSNNLNLLWGTTNDIDTLNNWWGTTDVQAINQTIGDFKNDFNQGKVNFVPFLTQPNPQAPAIPAEPSPAPTPTPNPTATATANQSGSSTLGLDWVQLAALGLLAVIVVLLVVVVVFLRKRSVK